MSAVRARSEEGRAHAVQVAREDREAHEDVHVGRAGTERGRSAPVERNAAVQDNDRSEDYENEVESDEIRKAETGPRLDRRREDQDGNRKAEDDEEPPTHLLLHHGVVIVLRGPAGRVGPVLRRDDLHGRGAGTALEADFPEALDDGLG